MGLNNKITIAFIAGFENRCIRLIVAAYHSAIHEKSVSVDWNENDITAQLHEYIDSDPLRIKWYISSNVEHHLPKDSIKKEKGFSAKYSRIDLRFSTINSHSEFKYFLEAKNLKEKNYALKRRYIKTGIDNFISKKYPNGCLVGYLLEGNLDLTVIGINSLLNRYNRSTEIMKKQICNLHDCYYESSHPSIKVKHYIFDFTIQICK
jgi:hypothetical protein